MTKFPSFTKPVARATHRARDTMSPASGGRSVHDVLFGPWMKPMGALIYFHQWIDQELAALIWLMKARQEALRLGRWGGMTWRTDPPRMPAGQRIHQFAELARLAFAAFACFVDMEARITIDRLDEDLFEANRFRNTLVHGRWAGHSEGKLTVLDPQLRGADKWIRVTPEVLEARGREAFELILRLRELAVWIQKQNAEVTRLKKQRNVIRLLQERAGLRRRNRWRP